MASLKEIKNRITSVKSTLKITSAMKMVASAKLHKAQQAIENMRPYEARLAGMLSQLQGSGVSFAIPGGTECGRVALVIVASNSSLCGAFNSNVAREARQHIAALEEQGMAVDIFTVGRKASDAVRRMGRTAVQEFDHLVETPSYQEAAALAQQLMDAYAGGRYAKVYFLYNHFVSMGSQKVVFETYLPAEGNADASVQENEYILEPSAAVLAQQLVPKVLRLAVYTIILDSVAAEHAARTVAMQTATDNAEDILQNLTLEYNKGRQQKITNEILDLVGGSLQQ